MKNSSRTLLFLASAAALTAQTVAPAAVGAAPNSTAFGDRIFFAGQPAESDFAEYRKRGVKTVVNLRTAAEMEKLGFDEAAAVKKAGMQYVHIPFGAEPPAGADMDRLLSLLDGAKEGSVLMHCASSNRVGYVWSVYRARRGGLPADSAIAEGKAAGLRNPALEQKARAAIAASR